VIVRDVVVEGDVRLAGSLCLPDDSRPDAGWPAVLLLGGTGGDTRDGDLAPERSPGVVDPPKRGMLRHIAHHLAGLGIASLRCDKRGCGASGGTATSSDYDTDLVDNLAALEALAATPGVDLARVALAGHSAGAYNACLMCRERPTAVAAVGLLSAMHEPIDDLLRRNWCRIAAGWDTFTKERRQWLIANRPSDVVGSFRMEDFIAAARGGDDWVDLEAHGIVQRFSLVRFRQDLWRPCAPAFDHVRVPALVLHGSADLNVDMADAFDTYGRLVVNGNEAVTLVVLAGLDHSYRTVPADVAERIWERVSLMCFAGPTSPLALDAIGSWAAGVLQA